MFFSQKGPAEFSLIINLISQINYETKITHQFSFQSNKNNEATQ